MMSDEEVKQFREHVLNQINEVAQLITDEESLISRFPDKPPLDIEPERIYLANLRKVLAAIDNGEWIDPQWAKPLE